MIQLIVGKKGSGKTKRLIALTNEAARTRHGSVLFVDDDMDYQYVVNHRARFVNVSEYFVKGVDTFYGFICGLAAQDFDLDVIYVDAFLKIVDTKIGDLEEFFEKLKKVSDRHEFDIVFSVSADESEVPEGLKGMILR